MTYIFCGYRSWTLKLYEKLSKKYKLILISSPKQLTFKRIEKIKPTLIFFPDWSWIVPSKIVKNYKCVCFHESNLPSFRGGSPIQNQIIRGIKKTKSTAFLMNDGLDTGNILLQQNLSLVGSLDDIFERMILNDYNMILKIIDGKYKLKKQKGKSTTYKRRKPEESELKTLNHSITYLHDFIRMLSDPYPNAFIKIGKHKIIFKSSKLGKNKIQFMGEIE